MEESFKGHKKCILSEGNISANVNLAAHRQLLYIRIEIVLRVTVPRNIFQADMLLLAFEGTCFHQ